MKAIFYDRKNKCEVSSDQLMEISLWETYAAVDNEGFAPGTPVKTLTDEYGEGCLSISTRRIGELGYKSDNCPSYKNWDYWCNTSDLVFLRLE